jgi:phosphinothricin acetyltransferase
MEVCIRPATQRDLPFIAEIYAGYVRSSAATFETEPPDAAEIGRRWYTVTTAGYPYLVADCAGAVVGYAYAGPYRARPAYRYSVEDSIYVRPDSHRKGLGRLLLGQLIEQCCERRYQQMIAVIGGSGNAASIRLHEAFGFRHVGTLLSVGFKFDSWQDTVIMQRCLGQNGDGPTHIPGVRQ